MTSIKVGEPMPPYCQACQSIPTAGFCNRPNCHMKEGHGTTERPPHPWEAEKASLQSEIEALRGERDDLLAGADADAFRMGVLAASLAEARGALDQYRAGVVLAFDNLCAQCKGSATVPEPMREYVSALPSVSEGVGVIDHEQ